MVTARLRAYSIPAYFALAFAISWAAVLVVAVPTGVPGSSSDVGKLIILVFLAMLLGPSIASLSLTAALDGTTGIRALFGRFARWRLGHHYLAVLVAPVALLLLGLVGLKSSEFVPSVFSVSDKSGLALLALVYGLGAGFFEELGWTGFALPRMQQRYGVWRAGLLLGVAWGLWHLLASYWGAAQSWGALYIPYFVLWCIGSFTAYRVLMSWTYSRTGSLLLAQLMHAAFTGGQALLSPPLNPGVPSLMWYAAFAGLLWAVVGLIAMSATQRGRALRLATQPLVAVMVFVALWGLFVVVLE
jgi:membrane protease YdiL (CAAX protease family)